MIILRNFCGFRDNSTQLILHVHFRTCRILHGTRQSCWAGGKKVFCDLTGRWNHTSSSSLCSDLFKYDFEANRPMKQAEGVFIQIAFVERARAWVYVYMCVCVCMCVCLFLCVSECVFLCACVRVWSLKKPVLITSVFLFSVPLCLTVINRVL